MISLETPLVLGSGSPRRRDILSSLGVPMVVVVAGVPEEVLPGEDPPSYLARVVLRKLSACAEAVPAALDAGRCGGLLVADTIVVVEQDILGKPVDVADAAKLLARLVGRTHTVFTRYAIASAEQLNDPVLQRTVETAVTFRAADAATLKRYAESGEGLDKAGAYAAQGIGTFLIERIDGSYTNVVGLPACELVADLCSLGMLEHYP